MAAIRFPSSNFTVPLMDLPSPGTAGADVFQAAADQSQALMGAWDKRSIKNAQIRGSLKKAKAERELDDFIEQANRNGMVGEGFTQEVDNKMREIFERDTASAADDNERDFINMAYDDMHTRYRAKGLAYESDANEANNVGDLVELANTVTSRITKDPAYLQEGMQILKNAVAVKGGKNKVRLTQEFLSDAVESAVRGQRTGDDARAFAAQPELSGFADPRKIERAVNAAESAEMGRIADADRVERKVTKEREERSKAASVRLEQTLDQPNNPNARDEAQAMFREMRDTGELTPDDITKWSSFFRRDETEKDDPSAVLALTDARLNGANVGKLARELYKDHRITKQTLDSAVAFSTGLDKGGWRGNADEIINKAIGKIDDDDSDAKARWKDLQDRLKEIQDAHPEWTNQQAKPVVDALFNLARMEEPLAPIGMVKGENGKMDEKATFEAFKKKMKSKYGNDVVLNELKEWESQKERLKKWRQYEVESGVLEGIIDKAAQR